VRREKKLGKTQPNFRGFGVVRKVMRGEYQKYVVKGLSRDDGEKKKDLRSEKTGGGIKKNTYLVREP